MSIQLRPPRPLRPLQPAEAQRTPRRKIVPKPHPSIPSSIKTIMPRPKISHKKWNLSVVNHNAPNFTLYSLVRESCRRVGLNTHQATILCSCEPRPRRTNLDIFSIGFSFLFYFSRRQKLYRGKYSGCVVQGCMISQCQRLPGLSPVLPPPEQIPGQCGQSCGLHSPGHCNMNPAPIELSVTASGQPWLVCVSLWALTPALPASSAIYPRILYATLGIIVLISVGRTSIPK